MAYTPNSDWRTTKGNIAPDAHWSGTDDAYNAREQLKREVEAGYSGAVVVRDATRTYNCHAYVHAQRHAWFNDITRFIEDDYYPFTPGTLQINDAVVYVKDNQITHSGFIIGLSGNQITRIRSKWGAYPEVEHPPGSVPSIYGGIVYYLRRRAVNMQDSNVPDEDRLKDKVQDLIYQLTSTERVRQLWLASTPEVAEKIVQGFPELTELQLYGRMAGAAVTEHIKTLSDERVIPLLAAIRSLRYQAALPILTEKAGLLKDEPAFGLYGSFLTATIDGLSRGDEYSSSSAHRMLQESVRYSVYVGGFGLSESADGPETAINYDEVVVGKFLHVHVQTNLPADITTLEGKYRKVLDSGTGNPADDRDLGVGRKIRDGQFEFVLTHYVLDEGSTYFIRIADTFTGDIKCLGSSFIKTRRG